MTAHIIHKAIPSAMRRLFLTLLILSLPAAANPAWLLYVKVR
jgi:hypothetical protein